MMTEEKQYRIPGQLSPFISPGSVVVRSPGRINLIGEHTDYNKGFVLPAAIDKAVYVVMEKTGGSNISLFSVDFNESVEVELVDIKPVPGHWSAYILGVVDQFVKRNYRVQGFRLAVCGDLPLGAGLSSSAAIECAVAFAINQMFLFEVERKELAKMAQSAEHEFAGVNCGIMDQFASLFGKKDRVLKLDCRSLDYEYFPVNLEGYNIILFDTQVKHSLASSEYNVRRSECEEGVAMLQQHYPEVESLRDASPAMVEELLSGKKNIYDRCRYIVEENIRLQEGCIDLQQDDLEAFGQKMFATHIGLSEQYEVSCRELDFLVNLARKTPGVIGARMMGGGFGGCTINIIRENEVERVTERFSEAYSKAFQKELKTYKVRIENGTSCITP